MTQDGLWYMILHHTFSLTSRSEGVDEEWRDFPHDEECISARDKLLVEFEKYKLQKEEAKSS
jgi:hypothetical protein